MNEIDFFTATAKNGFASGKCILGKIHYYGYFGVPKDKYKAMLWFLEAAEQDHAESIYCLSALNWDGIY